MMKTDAATRRKNGNHKKDTTYTRPNCFCDVCGKGFFSPKPRRSKYCSGACRSAAYRSRNKVTKTVLSHTMNLEENVDVNRIEQHSKIAADNMRKLMAMYGRDAFELAMDAAWDILVGCDVLKLEKM